MEEEVISGHKTLLQKWEIPLEHLDFNYLRSCKEIKKVERILRILRSGEEGFYPDLTKFAENRLTELDPQNKLLRVETKALPKSHLDDDLRKDLEEFHEKVSGNEENIAPLRRNLPPVRALNKEILENFEKSTKEDQKKTKTERIKSFEYEKWDKFDADAEELKVDLDEERLIEKHKSQKQKEKPVIEEIFEDDFSSMTEKERKVLALRYKDKGNDYFRAKEYEEAIDEYTKSLRLFKIAATFNNRAIAYTKTKEFHKAVKDCDKCLEIEPNNIKALIRKGQALQGMDQRRDAYEVYCKALLIDPNNVTALELTTDLRKQLPDLPLPNSTRIQIVDEEPEMKKIVQKSMKNSENVKKAQEIQKYGVKKEENVEISSEKVNGAPKIEETKIKRADNDLKIEKNSEASEKNQEIEEIKVKKSENVSKIVEKGEENEQNSSKPSNLKPIKKDDILTTYKQKLQEQRKKKQEYKEHFKQMFEGTDDVFLLPHHNKKNQEFIIAESKDQKKK